MCGSFEQLQKPVRIESYVKMYIFVSSLRWFGYFT